MKKVKKLTAFLLTLVMVVSVLPVSAKAETTVGAGTIELHNPAWTSDDTYYFTDVEVTFEGSAKQKIFCLSVDNKGYFVLPADVKLGNSKITGIGKADGEKSGFKYCHDGEVTGGSALSSITVIGKDITDSEIKTFLKGLTFYRNGVAASEPQRVTVVANTKDLEENTTAMAVEGDIHYYRYVAFDDGRTAAPTDGTKSWYDAYNAAKNVSFDKMQGYLATITSANEQLYLYGNFEKKLAPGANGLHAWIGGARTVPITWDQAVIKDNALNPGTSEAPVTTWYWVCGPEAGKKFYITNAGGTINQEGTEDKGSVIDGQNVYNGWNRESSPEPNNSNHGQHEDSKDQEYALEYGYEEANWNDYSPYNKWGGQYGIDGYIIEFSPYQKPVGSENAGEKIEADTPTVKDTKIIRADGIYIMADDFSLTVEEAKQLTSQTAKGKADAKVAENGAEIAEADIQVDATQLQEIQKGKPGEYALTFKYDGKEAVVTVTVEDKGSTGEGNEPYIEADDFLVSWEELGSITEQQVMNAADAARYTDSEQPGTKDVSLKEGDLKKLQAQKEPGKVPVTFTDSSGNEKKAEDKQVTVTVVDVTDEKTVTDNGKDVKVKVGANAFDITLAQASLVYADPTGDEAQALVKALAGAAATMDGKPVPVTDISVDAATIIPKKGTYDVTFSYKGAKVTVQATVKDTGNADKEDNPTVPKTKLTANDFSVKADVGASDITEEEFLEKAKVVAKDENGSTVSVTVDEAGLAALNKAIKEGPVGEHKVTVKTQDGTETKVTVTVIGYPYIAGNDFIVGVDEVKNQTEDSIKTHADAQRIVIEGVDGKKEPIHVNNMPDITGAKGPGWVKVDLADTTDGKKADEASVKAVVVDEVTRGNAKDGSDNADIVIGANNFSLTVTQAQAIEKDREGKAIQAMIKDLANVVATDDGEAVLRTAIQITGNTIQAENGKYKITFAYRGQTVEVEATVKGKGASDTTSSSLPTVNLTANDFTVPAKSTPLSPEDFLKNANAEAQKSNGLQDTSDDGSLVAVKVKPEDLQTLNDAIAKGTPGVVEVTLSADGVSTKVNVTITDTAVSGVPAGKPAETIAANNITVPSNDVAKLDKDSIINAAKAHAYETETKAKVAITDVDTSKVKAQPGTYDIILKTANGTATTIQVTVTEASQPDPSNPSGKPGDSDKEIKDESHMSIEELSKRNDLPLLLAKGIGGDKKISLSWLKYKGATGYEVHWSYCNGKKIFKKLTSTKKLKATHKKLSYKKSYKYFVIAYKKIDGKKVYIAKSPWIHVAMKKNKQTNAKKITVKKSKLTMKVGKTSTIKASIKKENNKKVLLKHSAKFRYYTDDRRVATVNKKGKIKAVGSGKCYIYVIANNGVYKKIKVTVK